MPAACSGGANGSGARELKLGRPVFSTTGTPQLARLAWLALPETDDGCGARVRARARRASRADESASCSDPGPRRLLLELWRLRRASLPRRIPPHHLARRAATRRDRYGSVCARCSRHAGCRCPSKGAPRCKGATSRCAGGGGGGGAAVKSKPKLWDEPQTAMVVHGTAR